MTREELIEKMCEAGFEPWSGNAFKDAYASTQSDYRKGMAAALDIAVGELLGDVPRDEWDPACVEESRSTDYSITMTHSIARKIIASRRSRYLPKSDPAVEAAGRVMLAEMDHFGCKNGQVVSEVAAKVVAAVRAADKGSHALR